MRNRLFLFLLLLPLTASSQIGVAFHQSNLPFAALHVEAGDRFRLEGRVGTDLFLDDLTAEGIVSFDLADHEAYEIYLGIGGRAGGFSGLVIPAGLNVYPFPNRQFGFHIELAPILGDENILRGSWGVRYRFRSGNP